MALRYPQLVASTSFEGGQIAGVPDPDVAVCPRFHHAIELLGRRWSGAIVYSLFQGPLYFRQIAAAVPGVSDRLLAERLRELEAEGIVQRSVHDGPPTRVSYSLTEAGEELEPMLRSLKEWANRRLPG